MVKYDTSRPIQISMDYTDCRGCQKDKNKLQKIKETFEKKGFKVVKTRYGPGSSADIYNYDFCNCNDRVAILLVNGADPANIREAAQIHPKKDENGKLVYDKNKNLIYNYTSGYKYSQSTLYPKNNVTIIAWWYTACDPVNPGGGCEDHIRDRTSVDGYLKNPRKYIGEYNVPCLCKHTKDIQTIVDYIEKMFIITKKKDVNGNYMPLYDVIVEYGWSEGKANTIEHELNFYGIYEEGGDNTLPSTTITDTTITTTDTTITTDTTTDPSGEVISDTVTITDTNEKTITQQIIDETYTKAYFQEIQALKTDSNGVFKHKIKLPFNGKYNVNVHYGGSKNYAPSTKSFLIDNKGVANFTPVLVEKSTTTTYSDGKTEIVKNIDSKGNKHTYTVRTIINFENGIEKSRSTEIIQNDTQTVSIISNTGIDTAQTVTTNPQGTTTTTTTPLPTVTPTTPTTPTVPVSPTLTGRHDPFSEDISLTERGTPNVEVMGNATYNYKWYNKTGTYTITKEQYVEVMRRDSKCLQLNNYKDSKYTAFRTKEEPNTFHVIDRESWNAVEESLIGYLIPNNTKKRSMPWPEEIIVDFSGNGTNIINGKEIKFKDRYVNSRIVKDSQDWGDSCGPTACSQCTQVLHNYFSEVRTRKVIGGGSTGWDQHINGMKKLGNETDKGYFELSVNSSRDKMVEFLKTVGAPVVVHGDSHYVCAAFMDSNKEYIWISDSATNWNGSPSSGWNKISTVKSYMISTGEYFKLNWTFSEDEKRKLNHFYTSMGGAWSPKFISKEKVRASGRIDHEKYKFYGYNNFIKSPC